MNERFRFAPGKAHRCLQCGASCYHAAIGPILPREIAAIDASSIREAMPDLPEALHYSVKNETTGTEYAFLHTRKAHCVFLTAEQRCGIHQHLGVEAKPLICRTFPYVMVKTPTGIFATNTMECRRALEAIDAGMTHEEKGAELAELWPLNPAHYIIEAQVKLTDEVLIDYETYEALEARLLETLADEAGDLDAQLREMAQIALDATGVGDEPLSDNTFEGMRRGLFLGMAAEVQKAAGTQREPLYASRWSTLSEVAQSLVNWIDVPRVTFDNDCQRLMRRQLQSLIAGKLMIARHTLVDGIANARFQRYLTTGMAAYRTAQSCRYDVTLRDYNDAVVLVEFMLRTPLMTAFVQERHALLRKLFLDTLPR